MSPAERRAAIVAATGPLLAQYGGDVTTRQIAEAAGIAEGTIFRAFPDKRALFLAVAEEAVNPPTGPAEMATAIAARRGLPDQVAAVVDLLVARMENSMRVMMALRPVLLAEGAEQTAAGKPPGPPEFVVEANRQLLGTLADLLFGPHAEQLRVPPVRAALVLRSLVFGAWHPGMPDAEHRLSAADIADVVLDGILAGARGTGPR